MKPDFYNMPSEFHRSGRLSNGKNDTSLSLIPKFPISMDLGEFTPISLVGCVYKLLSKNLKKRLEKVIALILGPFQGVLRAKQTNF